MKFINTSVLYFCFRYNDSRSVHYGGNMKKFLLCCLACLMLTGCTQTKPDASSDVPDTLGSKLVNQFQKHAKEESDPMEIAQKIVADDLAEISLDAESVEPGWLNGFYENVTGFTKGVMIAPVIGSIPYVSYVFETDDPEALVEELDEKHNMRWNICTEAEEKVSSIYENLVYYAMVPGEEDE